MIFPHIPQVEQKCVETDKFKRDLESGLHFHPKHPAPGSFLPGLVTWTQSLISPMHQPKYETPRASLRYLVLEMGLCAVLPLLKHLGQFIQATVVKMEDLVLALPARHHQLPTGTCLITVGTMENNLQGPPSTRRDQQGHGPSGERQCKASDKVQHQPSCPFKQGTEAVLHLWDSMILMGHFQLRHFMIVWHGHSDNFLHLCLVTALFLPFLHMKELKFVFPGEKTTGSLSQKH